MPKCDICEIDSVRTARDDGGRIFRACMRHAKYLKGWVRDSNYESFADSEASRAYECAAYGDD